MLTVTLGPQARLHRGYHAALLDFPPPTVRYVIADPTVDFASYVDTNRFCPSDHFAVCEGHVYDGDPCFVHSVHFPVQNGGFRWALETDSLLAHLQFGSVIFNARFSGWLQNPAVAPLVAERLLNMLELVSSPRCVSLVFHSYAQMASNKEQCLAVLPRERQSSIESLFRKAVVCYPAQPPRISGEQLRIRNANSRRGIVFAASGFEGKGGRVVLQLYRRLLARDDVELCYVGPIPTELQRDFADVLAAIQYAPQVPRELLLEIFTQAHILVHPSRHEALGITFLEALSCGLAIITTSGPGMENVGEIIEDGVGGTLVRKLSVHEDPPVDAVFDAVTALLDDPDRYDAMSRHNLSLVQDGPFSLRRRNEVLLDVYGRSGQQNASAGASTDWTPSRVAGDDRLFHYACQFSAVAEATRQSFTASRPATESSLLVPALSVSDASPPHGSDWAALARTSDLLFNERGKVHG